MFYVVGLGNPGEQHQDTAHNIGWAVVDLWRNKNAIDFSQWQRDKMMNAEVAQGHVVEAQVLAVKPMTFMNESGRVFKNIQQLDAEKVVVIYDDIDLPFGVVKLSKNKGSGGHNGIKSIEQHLGSRNFIRIRVGVCPTDWFGKPRKPQGKDAVARYLVHRQLGRKYTMQYKEIADEVDSIMQSLVREGYTKTISRR